MVLHISGVSSARTSTKSSISALRATHPLLLLLPDDSGKARLSGIPSFRVKCCSTRTGDLLLARSLFLGDRQKVRTPCRIRIRKFSSQTTVSARALEDRPLSSGRWNVRPHRASRWDKVRDRHTNKGQGKPAKRPSEVAEQTSSTNVVDTDGIRDPAVPNSPQEGHGMKVQSGRMVKEAESSAGQVGEALFGAKDRILKEAKKQSTVVRERLRNFDAKKFFSTTVEAVHHTPVPPFTGSLVAGLGALLLCGILLDMILWKFRQASSMKAVAVSPEEMEGGEGSLLSRAPSALSVLLDRDLRRKESVEWLNMIIGKLWNLYRRGLENWFVSLLQPVIDDLEKPDYVKKVQVKQFFLGDEPVTVRTVERRTSRRADDLQYHVGVRYTGGARLLLLITLKWGIIPFTIPVGVRGLDVDAEVWVKFRMIPIEPWVGQATWAFVTLPKIKLALAPFRLVNLMAIPFLSIFLAKLLTEDLPQLFVRPNMNVIDFLQGRTVGPLSKDFKDGFLLDGTGFSGELSVTLIEARRLSFIPYMKTDPYVIFVLGEQVMRSKRNSQTSIIGPAGGPVWNQDFKLLVVDQNKQHLSLTVHDTIGFTSFPVGSADIDLKTLQDTVPVDRRLTLKSGWGPFPKRFAGELIVRLTYKAYIDEDGQEIGPGDGAYTNGNGFMNGQVPGAIEQVQEVATFFKDEAGKVAEFFQDKELAKEIFSSLPTITSEKDIERALPILGFEEKKVGADEPPVRSVASDVQLKTENGSVDAANTAVKESNDRLIMSADGGASEKVEQERVIVANKKENQTQSLMAQLMQAKENPTLFWLAVITGVALIVALDLNWTNVLNP